MPRQLRAMLVASALAMIVGVGAASAADSGTPGTGTEQVEHGVKKVGEGVEQTASGVGHTVIEGTNAAGDAIAGGAKKTGRIVVRAGKRVGQGARVAWETVRDRAIDIADEVVRFVKRPF